MTSIHDFREQYGDVYITEAPDGLVVPWRPLSIGEYFEYEIKFGQGIIAPAVLEDEIFRKCVADEVIVNGLDRLKAGTVTTVVATIMQHSGPVSANDIENALESARHQANQVIHKMVTLICRAFPGYKPEDLYTLNYDTFMLRLAQAEDKLIQNGSLSEPLSLTNQAPEQPTKAQPPVSKKPKVDLGKLAQEYAKQKSPTMTPALPSQPSQKVVITKSDMQEHQVVAGDSAMPDQQDAVASSGQTIYKDYTNQMGTTGKVQIASHEERVAEAKRRKEENDKRYAEYLKKYESQNKIALENAERIKAERITKKKKIKRRQ